MSATATAERPAIGGAYGAAHRVNQANWYYIRDDVRVGPVTQGDLCELFRTGSLPSSTLVHSDAFEEWVPASSIAALRALCEQAPPVARPAGPAGERARMDSFDALDYAQSDLDGPSGIAGWLVLPAIGMVFNPLRQAVMTLGFWVIADKVSAGKAVAPILRGISAGSFRMLAMLSAIFCLYQVFTAVLFFGKRRAAPAAVIGLFVANIVFNIILVAMTPTTASANQPPAVAQLLPAFAVAGIWIPYFLNSKRVKNTFVN